ncbi:hypothetical protein [Streptomyces sp. NPDC047097]|uniref:hypothetical protein n=1 Tax=Streptomyces sp. NPDC047097 TaxID=3155260 RepID=UPI0033CDBD6D
MTHYADTPPQTYEVTWMSGHTETVRAHQVSYSAGKTRVAALGGDGFSIGADRRRVSFHAEVDGQWLLQLSALEEDIRTIRNITGGEPTPGGEMS